MSYSHADRKFARWLMARLEGYRVPKRLVGKETPFGPVPPNLRRIFRDRDELASASDLGDRIRSVIAGSEALIVICSPAAARSSWVAQEILAFKRVHGPERVFCVIVDGDPGAGEGAEQCFPRPLRFRVAEDGELSDVPVEPVAADVRAEGDGRRRALMKTIAGLLGVGYDELVQRELVRRYRRMTAIMVGALAGMALASVLAGVAYVARQDAERRREQAEDLLGFLVGDMQERLAPLGRLDVLETVLDKTMVYFAGLGRRDLTDTALARRAQALIRIGEVRMAQGRVPEARESFEEALDSSAALARRDPASGRRLFDRGQAEFWVGYAFWKENKLDEAQRWFVRYRDTTLALVALDPDNPEWVLETVYGYHNLAVLERERGRLPAADEMFESQIVVLEGLLRAAPDDRNIRFDLSDALSWRGSIARRLGELERSEEMHRQSADLLRYLVDEDPGNKGLVHRLNVADSFVAGCLLDRGRPEAARPMLEAIVETGQALVAHDPENTDWSQFLGHVETGLAVVLLNEGEVERALTLADDAVARLTAAAREQSRDPRLTRYLTRALQVSSRIRLRRGDLEGARDDGLRALRIAREALAGGDGRIAPTLAGILVSSGEVEARVGDEQGARALWQESLALLAGAGDSRDPELLDPLARALYLSGDTAGADDVRARIDEIGYVPVDPWPGT